MEIQDEIDRDDETQRKIYDCVEAAVRAVKAWDGRREWEVYMYWLDDENFVINWEPKKNGEFCDDETSSQYAVPLLCELGDIAAEILNDANRRYYKQHGEWVRYSDLTWWGADGEEVEEEDGKWEIIQCNVRWEPEERKTK